MVAFRPGQLNGGINWPGSARLHALKTLENPAHNKLADFRMLLMIVGEVWRVRVATSPLNR